MRNSMESAKRHNRWNVVKFFTAGISIIVLGIVAICLCIGNSPPVAKKPLPIKIAKKPLSIPVEIEIGEKYVYKYAYSKHRLSKIVKIMIPFIIEEDYLIRYTYYYKGKKDDNWESVELVKNAKKQWMPYKEKIKR